MVVDGWKKYECIGENTDREIQTSSKKTQNKYRKCQYEENEGPKNKSRTFIPPNTTPI